MTKNNEIVFDSGCGIPEEEQRDILAQINGIAEKNRQSLSSAADPGEEKNQSFTATKTGGFFPVLVNAAAVTVLVAGFFILSAFQGRTDTQVREGTKVYNAAERALIDEIRKETSSRLKDKENEISLINSQLEGIDAELRDLLSNNQELSTEQKAAQSRLKSVQEEHRRSLSSLQEERSDILEEARMRESSLQAQLESRIRELTIVSPAGGDIAYDEIDRLSREQTQAAAVEAQMAALFANLNNKINLNRLDEAAEIIKNMRSFLNTPSFQGLRSIQARKELYTQAINSFEKMIGDALKNQAALASGILPTDDEVEKIVADLWERTDRLEKEIADRDKTLASLNSGSGDSQRRINELQREATEKDGRIRSLETTNDTLTRTNTAQKRTIDSIQELTRGNIRDMPVGELERSLERIQEALQQ
jgi:septal ring factor EnvC (AmiA/AmiB activator)